MNETLRLSLKGSLGRVDYGLLLALVVPLLAVLPLLTHAGLPNTADGPAHLMRQVELNQAWQEGNFYPRWGTDLALGHGMPIFSYAPPALYQLTQLFHLLGLPLDEAMKAVVATDFLLYSLGMFLLARTLWGPGPGLLAAALYVYAPYRLRESYIQGNYGQFTGLAFYPFIFWAFHGLVTTGRRRYLVLAALSLAGLLFSHNISFMLSAPMLAAYLLLLLLRGTSQAGGPSSQPANRQDAGRTPLRLARLGQVAAAGLLGLGLAAIFWLPAFGERHAIKLEGITRGFFDFRENFIRLPEFLSPPRPLDLAAINPEFPLSLGLPQLMAAAAGGAVLLLVLFQVAVYGRRAGRKHGHKTGLATAAAPGSLPFALFFAFFLLLYAFLALPQSRPVWERVPLLELAEFPWRMLGPAIFCASLLGAYAFSLIRFPLAPSHPAPNWLLLPALLLVIGLNATYLYPSQFIRWGTPSPADAFAYEVTSGAIGTTSTGEFLPAGARVHPRPETLWPDYAAGRLPQKVDPASLPPGATAAPISHQAEADTLAVETLQPFTATVRTLYWPGWQVYLDGQVVPFTVADRTGLIQVPIPAGRHILALQLASTPLRTAGQWITIFSAVSLAIIALASLLRVQPAAAPAPAATSALTSRKLGTSGKFEAASARFLALTTGGLLLVTLLSRPLAPLFVLQSDPDRPQPADRQLQIDFGRPSPAGPEDDRLDPSGTPLLRLVGADSLPETITLDSTGGATLEAVVYWRAVQPLQTNYSVFLHLDAPDGQTMATADEAHPDDIPTRSWPTGLYLRNLLRLQIPAGLPPIRYDLTVGLYNRETGERLSVLSPPAAGQTAFKLGQVWLAGPVPHLPEKSPLARFGPAISLWQAGLADGELVLYWQTDRPLDRDYRVFVHLLDTQGNLLGQADGVPYEGLYPFPAWPPGQVIEDVRALPHSNLTRLAAIAVGIYDPATGERLPATDASGIALPNNSYRLGGLDGALLPAQASPALQQREPAATPKR